MGRHEKFLLDESGIDRRDVGYYSTPEFLCRYLAGRAKELMPSLSSVFDPCVGSEGLVAPFLEMGVSVDSMDVVRHCETYRSNFVCDDFLLRFVRRPESFDRTYDVLIANPPYNCHETSYIRAHKKEFARAFSEVGTANMYAMFAGAMIDIARPGSIIALVMLDSFLGSHFHKGLRKKVLRECALRELLLCPTDLFAQQGADVRTCVMILEKGGEQSDVAVLNRPLSTDQFRSTLASGGLSQRPFRELILDSPADGDEIVIGCHPEILALFENARVGELFDCKTSISTGNDSLYLRAEKSAEFPYPFYKNPGSRRFFAPPNNYLIADFLELADEIPNFIVRNRKFLFREGISCSSMGVRFAASYMPSGCTSGVNASIYCDNPDDVFWLLAWLNSSLVTYLVRAVLLRGNMITSGYVSRIPVPRLSEPVKKRLGELAKQAYETSKQEFSQSDTPHKKVKVQKGREFVDDESSPEPSRDLKVLLKGIDLILFEALELSSEAVNDVVEFCADPVRRC